MVMLVPLDSPAVQAKIYLVVLTHFGKSIGFFSPNFVITKTQVKNAVRRKGRWKLATPSSLVRCFVGKQEVALDVFEYLSANPTNHIRIVSLPHF
jgi:hypothetical protein